MACGWDSICCSIGFVLISRAPWFAALPLHGHHQSSPSTTFHISFMFSFDQFLYICLLHLALAPFDWTYPYVLARGLRFLLRVIPNHISTCYTLMYNYSTILYTPLQYLLSMALPMCRILVYALEKPHEIVGVNTRCDAVSEIRDPPFRRAGPCTKCATHATHAVLDRLASAI
jgi:hypothetical protein